MSKEEVSTGYSSLSPFVWAAGCMKWSAMILLFLINEMDWELPSCLPVAALACVQKRSQLVPTVSVISSGLLSTKSMAARTTFALT